LNPSSLLDVFIFEGVSLEIIAQENMGSHLEFRASPHGLWCYF
jgi:hypothetical protein